jgi:hypothetical protein
VWAVGNYYTQSNPNVFRNLAEHWDGTRWTAIAPPNVGDQENTLFSVSTLPDGHAWAVGYYADQTFRIRTLAEYWNGTSWIVTRTVNPQRARDEFFSVKALSADDVWAVGGSEQTVNGTFHTLIEHLNGQRWTVVPSPDPGGNGNELFGVAAASSDRAWAVGQQQRDRYPGLVLSEQWNGRTWNVIPSPRSAETYDPYAAAPLGRNPLVVGDRENDASPQRTVSFDLRGALPIANVGSGENDFYGVGASGNTAWAVGRTTDRTTDLTSPLAERLDHGVWSVVPTPSPGGSGGTGGFGGVTVTPDGQAWAVGAFTTSSSANQALIEHYVP